MNQVNIHEKVAPFSPVPLKICISAAKISIKNNLLEIPKSSIAYLKDNNLKLYPNEGFLKITSFNRVNRGKTER